jgi:DNA-binding NarL/FixJ family response regulator
MIPPDLFHADIDLDFAFIMEHAVREIDKSLTIKITSSAKETLTSLGQLAVNDNKPRLIFLNDNLRDMPAINLLAQIREMDNLANTPVIIFSADDDPAAVSKALTSGANAYYPRPTTYRHMVNSLKAICDLWLSNKK